MIFPTDDAKAFVRWNLECAEELKNTITISIWSHWAVEVRCHVVFSLAKFQIVSYSQISEIIASKVIFSSDGFTRGGFSHFFLCCFWSSEGELCMDLLKNLPFRLRKCSQSEILAIFWKLRHSRREFLAVFENCSRFVLGNLKCFDGYVRGLGFTYDSVFSRRSYVENSQRLFLPAFRDVANALSRRIFRNRREMPDISRRVGFFRLQGVKILRVIVWRPKSDQLFF